MVAYKLHWFDGIGGRVEVTRILLAYGNIPYEMVNVNEDDWPKLKGNYLSGQLPILEKNGKVLTQSIAIARYFAKQLNLLGANDWEAAEADAWVDTIEETYQTMISNGLIKKMIQEHTEEVQAEITDTLRPFLERLEKHLLTTNGQNLVGNQLTWADLAIGDLYKRYSNCVPNLLLGFPEVKKFTEYVYGLAGIKEYVATRKLVKKF